MKPIILTTREVRGLLDGTISVIRRPIKPQPEFTQIYDWNGKCLYDGEECTWCWKEHVSPDSWYEIDWINQFAPFQPGEVLYAKETFCKFDCSSCEGDNHLNCATNATPHESGCYLYKATHEIYGDKWRSPVTMPREAARLFLCVGDVRAERVQDTDTDTAIACGAFVGFSEPDGHGFRSEAVNLYREAWDEANAKRGFGWDAKPWTWVWTVKTISADEAINSEAKEE